VVVVAAVEVLAASGVVGRSIGLVYVMLAVLLLSIVG
jgi:hypothetical protein